MSMRESAWGVSQLTVHFTGKDTGATDLVVSRLAFLERAHVQAIVVLHVVM